MANDSIKKGTILRRGSTFLRVTSRTKNGYNAQVRNGTSGRYGAPQAFTPAEISKFKVYVTKRQGRGQ